MIIAEAGHNGNGSQRVNKIMISEAAECGADVVKFQLYDTNKIKKPWQSRYFELWAAELTKEDVFELADHAKTEGIEIAFSVFDKERVRWCEDIGVKFYKIASRSIYDQEVWDEVMLTGKPVVASLGKWKEDKFPQYPANYLYCVSDYPAKIKELPQFGDGYAGFSDHSIGLTWAKRALDSGAKIIEKHFTLNRTLPGYNQAGSCEPWELKELVKYSK